MTPASTSSTPCADRSAHVFNAGLLALSLLAGLAGCDSGGLPGR